MRAVRNLSVLAAIAVLAGAFAGQVHARTIGANLGARPANATYGCESLPETGPFGGRFFIASGAQTCTYLGSGSLGNTSETTAAPFPGLVTRVRVKAGPRTGPTQVVVLQGTRSTTAGYACCFYERASKVFTPRPNAITSVPVRLPMRSDFDLNFGETVDRLGLSVLAPGIPIPAHETGDAGSDSAPLAGAWFPHIGPNDAASGRADSRGISGMVPLLNAELSPYCQAQAATGVVASQAGGCTPLVGARKGARVKSGRARVVLTCNAPIACKGRLKLQSRKGTKKGKTFAAARMSIPAGKRRTLRAKLTRAGRRLVRRRRKARVWANARITAGGGSGIVSRRITLRR